MQTYIQRDVRLLRNITNMAAFNRFVYLCANYAGQILNRDELAKQTGVDTKTILAWRIIRKQLHHFPTTTMVQQFE